MTSDRACKPSIGTVTATETQQNSSPEESPRSRLRSVADYICESFRPCRPDNSYGKKMIYVHLKTQEIFNSLVELYACVFAAQWGHFKPIADTVNPPSIETTQAPTQIASLYISHWFLDLYNSNREAIGKLTPLPFTEFYLEPFSRSSNEYDVVLCHLNSCLRPTMVKGSLTEDQMYVPRFAENVRWMNRNDKDDFNPFDIKGFRYNMAHFRAIIMAIKDKRAGWKTATLTNATAVGRPFWLFDWHAEHPGCSWFPATNNYDMEDVTYAYLIGVACTPNLSPQDTDTWQVINPGATGDAADLSKFKRITARRYFGSYEVDSYIIRSITIDVSRLEEYEQQQQQSSSSTSHKRARSDGVESETCQPIQVLALAQTTLPDRNVNVNILARTTFVYYERTILDMTLEKRSTGLQSLILDHNTSATI